MLKRDQPPSPGILTSSPVSIPSHELKRFKDYATPVKASNINNQSALVSHQTSAEDLMELKPRSRAFSPRETLPVNIKRSVALSKRKNLKTVATSAEVKATLMSPRPKESPRVALPSASAQAIFGSPLASPGASMANMPNAQNTPSKASPSNISALLISTPNRLNNPAVSLAEQNRIFEDCLKAATDNKINSKNTWSAPLIDYFAQLAFLKESSNGAGSSSHLSASRPSSSNGSAAVNFQRASCTLDGCVKIYSSRVDSIAEATTRLLNGLGATSSNGKNGIQDLFDDV